MASFSIRSVLRPKLKELQLGNKTSKGPGLTMDGANGGNRFNEQNQWRACAAICTVSELTKRWSGVGGRMCGPKGPAGI